MKKLFVTSLVALPCLLAGPAFADPNTVPPPAATTTGPSTPAGAAASGTPDRRDYMREVHAEMHDWQAKLKEFDREAAAKGEQISAAAKKDLRIAWHDTKQQSHNLEKAGADSWDHARVAFEEASHHLRQAWQRADPGSK